MAIGFYLLIRFAENEIIIRDIKYMAFIWICLACRLTINLMVFHIIGATIKHGSPFMVAFTFTPFILLTLDRLAVYSFISHDSVSLAAKTSFYIVVICKLRRFLLLFVFPRYELLEFTENTYFQG